MLLIDDAELLRDRGYIDGAWSAGRLRRDLPRARSRDGRGARRGAADGRLRDAARDRGRRGRAARLARAPGAGAGRVPARLRRPHAPPSPRPGDDHDARAGQAAGRVRMPRSATRPSFLEWFGEEAKRVYGDTIPRPADRHAHRRPQAAGRRVRRHHALELPLGDDHPQGRARAGCRQHDRVQARRADAALGAGAGRARRPRGHSGRRLPGRHRRRRGCAARSAAS